MNTKGFEEWSPETLLKHIGKVKVIDVRRPDEFSGELSHIQGAELVTLESRLDTYLSRHSHELRDQSLVFVCRSGARSHHAAQLALSKGYQHCINLEGGMIAWNQKKFPTEGAK